MTARLRALRPRERRLALAAAVLIGCWALVSWLVQPLWERARDLEVHVAAKSGKLEALTRLLAESSAVGKRYAQLAAAFKEGIDEQAQPSFLEELEALSRTAGVQLNLKPKPPARDVHTDSVEIELDVEGSQQNLMAFLDGVLHLPRLIVIDRVRIATAPINPNLLRANLVIRQLLLR